MTKSLSCLLLLLVPMLGIAQTPVTLAPPLHPQFTDEAGVPLGSGFLYTYAAGTTTLQNTFADFLGTISNPDPIPLDASGAPSNGTVQTGIWLANQSYKFCAYDRNLVQQWCTDNVTGYLGLLNMANTWTFPQTFTQPIVDTQTDNQFVLGAPGNQTTLDFPPPTGNVTLHFPNTADTMVGRDTTDTLTHKTLTGPALTLPTINGCAMPNGPATYICIPNATPAGTAINAPVKLINAPSQATVAATTDTSGIQGICVADCGNTGTAIIQQTGTAWCAFDGATTAGDYVQNSSIGSGGCHDAGATYPIAGQVLGQVLSTNASYGTRILNLFSPGVGFSSNLLRTISADGSATTVNASTSSQQIGKSTSFPAGQLNSLGKSFRATGSMVLTVGGGTSNQSIYWSMGNNPPWAGWVSVPVVTVTSSSTTVTASFQILCTVSTAGVSGVLTCSMLTISNTGTITFEAFTPPLDLTQAVYVGNSCSFSVASSLNTCTQNQLVVEQLN